MSLTTGKTAPVRLLGAALLVAVIGGIVVSGSQLLRAADPQREALADGVVTFEEYEAAVDRWLRCAEEAMGGGVVHSVRPDASGRYLDRVTSNVGVGAFSNDDEQRMDEAMSACSELHVDRISSLWYEQNALRRAEVPAAFEAARVCMVDVGADVGGVDLSRLSAVERTPAEPEILRSMVHASVASGSRGALDCLEEVNLFNIEPENSVEGGLESGG